MPLLLFPLILSHIYIFSPSLIFSSSSFCKLFSTSLSRHIQNYLPNLKEICSADEIKHIFSNVVVLRNFSLKLLQELEERMKNWGPTTLVGDIFLKYVGFIFYAFLHHTHSHTLIHFQNYIATHPHLHSHNYFPTHTHTLTHLHSYDHLHT